MVWTTVVFGLISVASDVFLWLEHRKVKQGEAGLRVSKENEGLLSQEVLNLKAQFEQQKDRADRAESRYDALVDKIRVQSVKPDDGIIHAKNSGDVRRLFEQQVAAQQINFEKQQEN